jgi:hypothetical protein
MPAPHIHDTQDRGSVQSPAWYESPREVDNQVLRLMGATPHNVAEYIWDHWLGEPDEPTLKCIEQETDRILADNAG